MAEYCTFPEDCSFGGGDDELMDNQPYGQYSTDLTLMILLHSLYSHDVTTIIKYADIMTTEIHDSIEDADPRNRSYLRKVVSICPPNEHYSIIIPTPVDLHINVRSNYTFQRPCQSCDGSQQFMLFYWRLVHHLNNNDMLLDFYRSTNDYIIEKYMTRDHTDHARTLVGIEQIDYMISSLDEHVVTYQRGRTGGTGGEKFLTWIAEMFITGVTITYQAGDIVELTSLKNKVYGQIDLRMDQRFIDQDIELDDVEDTGRYLYQFYLGKIIRQLPAHQVEVI